LPHLKIVPTVLEWIGRSEEDEAMMSLKSRRELLAVVAPRYQKANRREKQPLLEEFLESTGYGRKHATTLLNHPPEARPVVVRRRPRSYSPEVTRSLVTLWNAADRICSKRLVPFLPELIDALERHHEITLDPSVRARLAAISPATCDRLLAPERRRLDLHGRSTTKPGTLLKDQIPIRTFADWDDVKPGFFEIDLVAHCGERARGDFLYSLTLTDIETQWTECQALLNKSQRVVEAAVEQARQLLPFPLLGLDSDNGSEFINELLLRYCEKRAITFTRCRPYRKNDQCHVEQKNWTVVRQKVGYQRYEGEKPCRQLTQLYEVLRLYINYFQPSMKLIDKHREGAKVRKHYDEAQTPSQRVLASPHVADTDKAELRLIYQTLNPSKLLCQIERLQEQLWDLAVDPPP
jgi:hypothetical protein